MPNFLKDCKAMKEESTMPCICKPGFAGVALMLLAVMIRFSYSNAVTNPADSKCGDGLSFSRTDVPCLIPIEFAVTNLL